LCNNHVECRERPLLKPKFRYTANIHGDEATGRGLVVYLAQYLLTEKDKNPQVNRVLENIEVHIVPTINPDGFAEAYDQVNLFKRTKRNRLHGCASKEIRVGRGQNSKCYTVYTTLKILESTSCLLLLAKEKKKSFTD
jgi:predicted deacylase